jgi:hypothetical protein
LTDASLYLFAKKNWDNLVSLHLGKNDFTDQGVVALMKTKFPKLKSFWLSKKISNYRWGKRCWRLKLDCNFK